MGWPMSQDYNEAVQSPAHNFADPDLRGAEAATNALGLPAPCSGNFADVYQLRCPDGTRWAVKCFTREVPGLRERYQEISKHLQRVQLPFTVGFTYLDQGIRVGGQWYPVLKMQWVEGVPLNQFVAQSADKPALLEGLSQVWARMGQHLRAAQVAHGDLQHGNVLLVREDLSLALKLVDYDGMWVPALAGRPSGEAGHPAYQHPWRSRLQAYGPWVDRFPLLLVATALCALKVKGRALWEKYDNGDNVLFRQEDLDAPSKSPLFYELLKSNDPTVRSLAESLITAARTPPAETSLLDRVLAEARLPLSRPQPAAMDRAVPVAQPAGAASPPEHESEEFEAPALATMMTDDRPEQAVPKVASLPGRTWAIGAVALGVVVLLLGIVAAGIYLAVPSRSTAPREKLPRAANRSGDEDREVLGTARAAPQQTARTRPEQTAKTDPLPSKELINSIGMKLVLIQEGTFAMGSPNGEAKEQPQHEVEISRPFYMGVCSVTRGQFTAFVETTHYQTEAESDGQGGRGYNAVTRRLEGRNPRYNWRATGFGQTDDHPVVNVTWNDAARFCEWLGKKEGKVYALPTEAEWEYACRAGTRTRFGFGDRDDDLKGNANVADASLKAKLDASYAKNTVFQRWDDGHAFTSPVGAFRTNPWGLCDMHGNVWQWCFDRFGKYERGSVKDPQGPSDGRLRVVRGGSWDNDPHGCRSAVRTELDPSYRDCTVGFRVVLRPAGRTP